ncbi:MAG: YihY/virulence factor BrkB family protein [Acidimicrobiales bacterium]
MITLADLRSKLPAPVRRLFDVVYETYQDYRNNRTIRLGAGLAYYAILAIFPLLMLAMSLAALLFDDAQVEDYLSELITDAIGSTHADAADSIVEQLSVALESYQFGLVGLGTLIFASSLAFVAVEDAFRSIWNLPVRRGFKYLIVKRLRAFVVVLGAAALMIVGLVVQSTLGLINNIVPDQLALPSTVLASVTTLLLIATLATALTVLYHELGPDELRWRPSAIGGGSAALAMTLGSVAMAYYFSYASSGSANVSWSIAAGPLVGLLWIYYQAQILLAGAHLVRVIDGGVATVESATTNANADQEGV